MRRIVLSIGLFLLLTCGVPVQAAQSFPPLTGRVVDNAHILSPSTIQSLDQSLEAYENGTSNQVVVATIASLNGDSIDDYGYQLGRYWHIGQKGKDNGVLLIVAPKERKVRIEVGYGLEPVLTDAASSQIVNEVILPDFRADHMEQGVVDGTQAILSVLGGKSMPVANAADSQGQVSGLGIFLFFLFILFAIRHPYIAMYLLMSSNQSSRFGGSGGGGGGFSGGGGSFGGGGASGSW